MTAFDAEEYSKILEKSFFNALGCNSTEVLIINASDVASNRDSLYSWFQDLRQGLKSLTASNLKELYEVLQTRVSNGDIGAVKVVFSDNKEGEPIQDKHPLLRSVDLLAHEKRSVDAYSRLNIDWSLLNRESSRFQELGDEYLYRQSNMLITHIFLDVENSGYFSRRGNYPEIENVLKHAVAYEQDVV